MAKSRSFASLSPSRIFDEGYTLQENPNLPLNVSSSELPGNRGLWKTDRSCIICSVRFKLLHHRYHCEFCYRAVCPHCSCHAFLHPESLSHQRCCNSCFSRFATTTLRQELADKLAQSKERMTIFEDELKNAKERKKDTEARLRDLEGQVRRGRLKMRQVDWEFEKEIEQRRETLGKQRRAREEIGQRRASVAEKLQELRSQSEHKRVEKQEHEEQLSRSRAHTQALKSQLSELQEETNHIIHGHVQRTLTPPFVQQTDERLQSKEMTETGGETEDRGKAESTPEEPDSSQEATHLEQLLSDLASENATLRRSLTDPPRRTILSERSCHPLNRRPVLAQPNRSCCCLF